MATLVLTVVGTIIGGPIGGAIGGLLGQAVDRDVLFKPKGREGPRLTELAVQTSSYGTPIQKVFGTMRIAGCVIWSTDLIESRSTSSGGKGQPSVTQYSYSASFAVALSARAIRGVGRIWADGKLLRGAAGDFKSATGYRLHLGREDQAADPLIASAEGAGLAPAHRGVAYAMFENFQLADYGNRIPSLTFEVIGDDGPVTTGAIVGEVSGGLIDGAAVTLSVPGFAAYGSSARGVIETLSGATGAWFAPDGAGLQMRDALVAGAEIEDAGFSREAGGGVRGDRALAAIETVPRAITLAHYDPARDYQTGLQRAVRPGAGMREERIELPAAIAAGAAKTIAEGALARAEAGRERRTVALGWDRIDVPPGTCVTIRDVPGVWRVSGWTLEKMVLSLECARLAAGTAPASASAGRVLGAQDLMTGTTIVHAFETVPLDDAILDAPRLTIVAGGTAAGWRRAALLYSLDGGARWTSIGASAAPAVIGTLATVPGAGTAAIMDRAGSFEVELAHAGMTLGNADAGGLDAGVNLALAGDELLQFGMAEQIGAARWRLSQLWRGRRGTEAAVGTQAAGDRFVLIERDAVMTIDLPLAAIGSGVRVMATGVGDIAGPVEVMAVIGGASVVPPSPVFLRWSEAGSGDAQVTWTRRSRGGWRWIDGVDAPLAEEREAYRVTIMTGAGIMRTVNVAAPPVIVTADERSGGAVLVSVRQIGTHGESLPTRITIS